MSRSPRLSLSPRSYRDDFIEDGRVVGEQIYTRTRPRTVLERQERTVPRTVLEEEQFAVQTVRVPRATLETELVDVPHTVIEQVPVEERVIRTRMVPRTVMVEEDYEDYEVHYVDEQRTEYRTEEQEVERIVYETYEREVPVDDMSRATYIHSDISPTLEGSISSYRPRRLSGSPRSPRFDRHSQRIVYGDDDDFYDDRRDSRRVSGSPREYDDDSDASRRGGRPPGGRPRRRLRPRARETTLGLDRSVSGLAAIRR